MDDCKMCGGDLRSGNYGCPVCNTLNFVEDVLADEAASMHSRSVAKSYMDRLECGGWVIHGRIDGPSLGKATSAALEELYSDIKAKLGAVRTELMRRDNYKHAEDDD